MSITVLNCPFFLPFPITAKYISAPPPLLYSSPLANLAYGIRDLRIGQSEMDTFSILFAAPETSARSEYQVLRLQISTFLRRYSYA